MNKSNPVVAYFVSSFEELRKVTWPTKEQSVKLTIITLAFSLASALLLGALDYVFNQGFTQLINLF